MFKNHKSLNEHRFFKMDFKHVGYVHGHEKLVKMTNCDTHSYHVLNISTLLISGKDERKAVGAIVELASSHETTSVVMIQIKNPSFLINHPYCCSLTPCRKYTISREKRSYKNVARFSCTVFFVECYQMCTVKDFS